ncbi:MAG: hypothetical protein J5739_05555 [Lachnospiraceae bacterium]|nr:hypothetical protein [Lachnospiraceae bacterium]
MFIYLKRYVLLLLFFVFALFASGCVGTNDIIQCDEECNYGDNGLKALIKENVPDLEILVTPPRINISAIPKYVTITVTNTSGDIEYEGSYHYTIERWDNGGWIEVYCPAVEDESIIIKPTESMVFKFIQLNPMGYNYSVGEYRVNYNNCAYGNFIINDE